MHAIIHVYTYKTGLLARMAHDLQLTVHTASLTVQGRHIRGFCAADSLDVDGVVTAKGLDTKTLSSKDTQQICETIRSEILQSDKHPRVEFDAEISGSAGGTLQVRGKLTIRGQTRAVQAELTPSGDRLQSAFELTPTDFGIAPYKALAGAIKLQDRVRVTIDVLLEGQNTDSILGGSEAVQLSAAVDKL